MPRLLLLVPLATLLVALDAAPAVCEDAAFERTLERLEHPLLGERERALHELVAGLPGTRDQVIAALPDAPWVVKLQLAHVLAADGSDAAIAALIDLFGNVDDVQAAAISLRIVDDKAVGARVLARFRASPKLLMGGSKAKDRLRALERLLRRAELEQKFLDHKSKTGGTGYYRGQYDALKYDRELALEIVLRIALDEAFEVPGRYTTGKYEFLHPRAIDWWEIQDMAINAVAELATPEDEGVLRRLEAYARTLELKCYDIAGDIDDGSWYASQQQLERQEDLTEYVGRWGDVVAALFIAAPERPGCLERVQEFLDALQNGGLLADKVRFSWWPAQQRAGTYIRIGWYSDATYEYLRLLRQPMSQATQHYNLACAYASWSLDPGGQDAEALRESAIRHLEYAVDAGWTDIGWMEQDRDLDPIRDTGVYRALVKRIQRELGVEPPPK